jgi:succinoglycan biosynthesis protein ExoU
MTTQRPIPSTAVIVAAFNAAATVERAVRSALAQAECAEVCVVDDASTDATAEIVAALCQADPRVTLVRQAQNAGPAAARNAAIAATTAAWITILDADDYMLPGRLAALHAGVGEADFIADALIRAKEGGAIDTAINPGVGRAISFHEFVLGNLGELKGPLDLGFVKPMFARAFLEKHTLRYQPDMRLGEDYEFYARALALGARFLITGPAGYVSIEREGSLSKNHSERDLQLLRDCDDGLAAIRPLAPAERRALARHRSSVDCRLQWRRLISAVKQRDAGAALSTFTSPRSALFLMTRLSEQAWRRSLGLAPERAS